MSDTKILIDTGSSPTKELIEKHGLDLIGIKIIMDKQVFVDGKDITHEEFFEKIRKAKNFYTDPPNVSEVVKKYKEIKASGVKTLFGIHFSEKMTKLVETSRNAANMVRGLDVHIFETANVSAGSHLIAEKLIELIESGKSPEELNALLPEIKASTYMQFSVSTLKYLIKNGRIGKAQGLVGSLLNLKPILGVEDGVIAPIAKVRGMDKSFDVIAQNALEFINKRPHNVKIFMNYGFERNKAWMEASYKAVMDLFARNGVRVQSTKIGRVWPTVACHSGPEGFAIGVYGEQKPIK